MKKILLFTIACTLFGSAVFAQCTADYDFMGEPFGVSPDPLLGESFEVGELGVSYEDVIHIKVPVNASDIDDLLPDAPIDSLELVSVELIDGGGASMMIQDIGLDVTCNNNGDSVNDCTFLGGSQYCALLSGVPTQEGEWQMIVTVLGHATVFGVVISQDLAFDQYTFIVGEDSGIEEAKASVDLKQNSPNPFVDQTTISFDLNVSSVVNFTVTNLLGEVVYGEQFIGKVGNNKLIFDADQVEAGIYLYSIESYGKRQTKRMVVQK